MKINLKNSESGSDEFAEWLDGFLNFEKLPQKNIFWLDTIKNLCADFGNPQDCCPCVHVAGSKGKGSVAKMAASILNAAGKKTGLYTSPHIATFYERVTENGNLFSEEVYSACADEMRAGLDGNALGGRPVTWFELVTLYAFLCFRAAKVDAAVYEVGLGGRLDATNIVSPKSCIINTIELEHTEYLGDTIGKIAAEKAGIIKNGVPVIAAGGNEEAKKAVSKKAAEAGAPLFFADEILEKIETDYCYDTNVISKTNAPLMQVKFSSGIFSRPINARLRLLGQAQAQNAFLAAAAVRIAFPEVDENAIELGLEAAALPGRFEIIADNAQAATVVLDGAHTVQSIKNTLDTFARVFPGTPPRLLFACASDKDMDGMARLFKNAFAGITLTTPGLSQRSNLERAAEAFKKAGLDFDTEKNPEKAFFQSRALAAREGVPLIVAGSFYLVATVRALLV